MWRGATFLAALAQVRGHSEEPLPDAWYEAFESARQFLDRRLVEKKPLPATLPDGGDPSEVNIFVIGDWGTYPGTGINMGSAWTTAMWNSNCFQGSSSPEAWKKAKAEKLISASEVVKSWGAGYPICGSMHLECSWGKGGVSNSDRCNPDKDWYWRDHFAQQNVATSMTDLAKERKPSFVINTADNFYYAGVKSTQDKLWSMMFEELYPDQSLQIQWLSSLGNHDYGGHTCDVCLFKASGQETRRDKPCSQAMIDYNTEHDWQWPKNKEVRWVLPMKGNDRWYMKSFVFKKANVSLDVFVIDTNKAHISSQCSSSCPARQDCIKFFMQLWERQKAWLLPALEQSKADWKFVVGHAPPENFEESLMEQMRDRGVSVYMAGHVHQLRHDQCPSGIEAIISGSGGVYQSAGGGSPYTIHETQDYGFATINVKWNKLSVEYWNDQGKRLWDPVVIPKVDLQQEGLLKKLREAALKSDLQAMKDAIAAAKNYGVEDRHVYTAAVAGVKAFEAEGGLAWVFMSPKIMKNDAGRTSGILASWTTEDRLPTTETRLVVASTCCSGATKSQYKDESVLCDPQEKCSPQKMAENLVDGGAAAMLLMSTDQILVDANNNSTKAFALPALSIPKDFVLHVPSWLSNKEEVISISYTGGEKGSQDAIEQARNAGVPEDMIEEATLASRQRRAIEHLKTAMESDDDQELRKAIDLADKSRAQNEIVELAKRRLTLKELEVGLANVNKNCDDFLRVHDMIERADAMHLSNTTAAQECRLSLALEALQYALNEGANCKEPMEKAVAWCKLANALEQKILAAEEFCKKQVGEQGMNSVIIWLVVFLILAIGVGGFWWLQNRKSMQASSATTGRPDGAGIELLDAS